MFVIMEVAREISFFSLSSLSPFPSLFVHLTRSLSFSLFPPNFKRSSNIGLLVKKKCLRTGGARDFRGVIEATCPLVNISLILYSSRKSFFLLIINTF